MLRLLDLIYLPIYDFMNQIMYNVIFKKNEENAKIHAFFVISIINSLALGSFVKIILLLAYNQKLNSQISYSIFFLTLGFNFYFYIIKFQRVKNKYDEVYRGNRVPYVMFSILYIVGSIYFIINSSEYIRNAYMNLL